MKEGRRRKEGRKVGRKVEGERKEGRKEGEAPFFFSPSFLAVATTRAIALEKKGKEGF